MEFTCQPVIDAHVPTSTVKEQHQQHQEISRRKFDTIFQDRDTAVFGNPVVITVFFENLACLVAACDGGFNFVFAPFPGDGQSRFG